MLKLQFTIDAVDRATAKLVGINRAVEKSVERTAAPYRRLRASINSLVEVGGLERLGRSAGRVREAWGGVADRFSQLPGAAALSIGGITVGLVTTIRRIDELSDVAKKLGIPIEMLQRMGYAAAMSGASSDRMAEALQFLSQNMAEALSGSKEAQASFRRVGLELAQLRKMNAAQVFEAIADKFEQVGNAGQNAEKKIQLTRALMGRGGADLIQMLNQGSGAFRELYAEADRAGVVSADMAGRFGDAADALDRMAFGANGFLTTITNAALPAIERLVKKFTDMGAQGRAAFGQQIGESIGRLLDRLPALLSSLASIAGGLATVAAVADRAATVLGGWETVIVAVSAAIVGKGVFALAMLAKSFYAVGAAVAVTPLGWFMAAVAGIAGAAFLIYKNWEPIKAWFSDLWDGIVAKFEWVKAKVGSWIPNWAKSGADQPYPVLSAAGRQSAVQQALADHRGGQMGGTLKIEIDGDGKPRVRELRTAPGSAINLDVYTGSALGMP